MPAETRPASRNEQPAVHWTIGGERTFALQPKLPPLPLPTLDETIARFLKSCEPLLSVDEMRSTTSLADAFLKGEGAKLQARLEARAAECNDQRPYPHVHWLEEWWDRYAYLSDRTPLPVRYNIFGTLYSCQGTSSAEARLMRAAQLLRSAALFYLELRAEAIAPDSLDTRGNVPLCMFQYSRLFGSSRVPGEVEDKLVTTQTAVGHVVVLSHGRAWSLRIIDGLHDASAGVWDGWSNARASNDLEITGPHKRPSVASVGEIAAALAEIERRTAQMGSNMLPVSLLSTLPRHEWAAHRKALQQACDVNSVSLKVIESSLLVLSLCRDAPTDAASLCKATHEGGEHGGCLWYDKPLTLIIYANGMAGAHMEHAHFDAPVTSRAFAFIARAIEDGDADPAAGPSPPLAAGSSDALARLSHLTFDLSTLPSVRQAMGPARAAFAALSANNDLVPVRFDGVGGQALRAAKIPPDSLMQMALQLAQWRDQHKLVATYETATTRRFLHGRTETIRSCSIEVAAFVRAMDELGSTGSANARHKVAARIALAKAMKEHMDWLSACSSGKGVDRHLMGLRIAAAEAGEPQPLFFEDVGYKLSSHFELSTSNMSKPGIARPTADFSGFGAPSRNSYGVCYDIGNEYISMIISTDRSCATRDAARFGRVIQQALADISSLLLDAPTHEKARSRL